MRAKRNSFKTATVIAGLLGAGFFLPRSAWAHCDTMDGPVVKTARAALEKGDITPVLKWVKPEYEEETRAAFKKSLAVRTKGADAQELADMYFFETVVRLHRAGEGAPYTGIKPAGTDPGPAVTASDKALETGKVDELVNLVTTKIAAGIRARFAHAADARRHADETAEAGRAFVAAYVEFVHYAEGLYDAATAEHAQHGEPGEAAPVHKHEARGEAGGAAPQHEPDVHSGSGEHKHGGSGEQAVQQPDAADQPRPGDRI